MSQNPPTDRTSSSEKQPDFYLPATPPTSATLGRIGRFVSNLFGRR